MKTRQDMIDFIYDKVVNKELSFGCRWINIYTQTQIEICASNVLWWNFYSLCKDIDWVHKTHYPHTSQIIKVIWHTVLILDIMDYLEKNSLSEYIDWVTFDEVWNIKEVDNYLIKYYNNKRLPLESQSDKCIEWIFNLISN